jgi:hypothetical protein
MSPPSSGSKVNQTTNGQNQAASLLGLLFNPEDSSDTTSEMSGCLLLQPRRPYVSSLSPLEPQIWQRLVELRHCWPSWHLGTMLVWAAAATMDNGCVPFLLLALPIIVYFQSCGMWGWRLPVTWIVLLHEKYSCKVKPNTIHYSRY